jgi:hypothetical protein
VGVGFILFLSCRVGFVVIIFVFVEKLGVLL